LAGCLEKLGGFYDEHGKTARAEPLYRRCLKIREAKLGLDDPDLAKILAITMRLSAAQGRWDEAARYADRMRRIERRHIAQIRPGIPYSEQLKFLTLYDEPLYHQALTLGLRNPDKPRLVELSAAWVINGKAVAQEVLGHSTLLAREGDERTADIARQLIDV